MRSTVLEPGELVVGKYQVKELLGRGGMGQVYLARHTITGKRVALKMLSGGLSPTAHADKRLVREAVASGCIEHRHVVNVFDIGEHQGSLFLVMEYLEGKSFKQLMHERRASDRELLEILLRAMDGVRAAHAQGVIHRDLKPDNILVCQGPTGRYDDPKVVDFGICRMTLESGITDLTQAGITMGSPFYMSLEQLQGARDIDGRADLYSLGVIVYQALTLRRPFEAATLGELTEKISKGLPPAALAELRPDLPRGLSRVVMRSLARTREKRQPDVATFIQELTPYVLQLSDTQPAVSSRPLLVSATQSAQTPMPVWDVQRARPWLQLGAAAMAAFALTLGGISLVRSMAKPSLTPQKVELSPQTSPGPTAIVEATAEPSAPPQDTGAAARAELPALEPPMAAAPLQEPEAAEADAAPLLQPLKAKAQKKPQRFVRKRPWATRAKAPVRAKVSTAAKPVKAQPGASEPAFPQPGQLLLVPSVKTEKPPIDTSDPYR